MPPEDDGDEDDEDSGSTPSASAAAMRPKQIDSDKLAPLAGYSSPTASPSSPAA